MAAGVRPRWEAIEGAVQADPDEFGIRCPGGRRNGVMLGPYMSERADIWTPLLYMLDKIIPMLRLLLSTRCVSAKY